jgi:hypothetical protein
VRVWSPLDGADVTGPALDPHGLVGALGQIWPWMAAASVLMGLCYVLATMISGVSTMRYAIVGFYGRRGQGKSFSQVYYARKWAQKYRDKDVWTNMARLDVEGRERCIGKPREWGAAITADGRTKKDASFTLRHHVHNPRDCWWCGGADHDQHGEAQCLRCDLDPCDRPADGRPLVHVECEYMDFSHAYDGLVVVDEAGQVFASTMWSKLPFAALKFMADTRKRRLLMLYSAHTPARVSKNLRELTDEAFECTSWKGFGFFKLNHFEGCLTEKTQVVYVPFLPSVKAAYDTEEIVAPPGGLVSMSEALGRREIKAQAVPASDTRRSPVGDAVLDRVAA